MDISALPLWAGGPMIAVISFVLGDMYVRSDDRPTRVIGWFLAVFALVMLVAAVANWCRLMDNSSCWGCAP